MNKYTLTEETIHYERRTLYRIKALKDFKTGFGNVNVKVGDLGGYVEYEDNLSELNISYIRNNIKYF